MSESPLESSTAGVAAGRAPERAIPSPRGALAEGTAAYAGKEVDPGQSGKGGLLTSRPPSNPISYGGEDWLTLSLYLRHNRFSRLVELLDAKRERAENRESGGDELTIADQRFLMLPFGAKAGSKGMGYFRWQMHCASGYLLLLMKREDSKGNLPNAKLVASSLVLMRLGVENVVEQAFAALKELGAEVIQAKVSRVDVCCDLPGRSILPLKVSFDCGQYVSRAQAGSEHGYKVEVIDSDYSVYWLKNEPTSFNLGRGAVRLRVYDKVRECIHNIEKLGALISHRWGMFPGQAVRAEFQLRRKKLVQLGVDSFADWIEKRSAICKYLTHEWFRLTADTVDRKHPDRTPILPEWQEVQAAFATWTGIGPPVELGPIASREMPPDHYLRSIIGSFVSLFARTGVDIDTNETYWNESLYRILDEIEHRDMAKEVARRVLELGVARAKVGKGNSNGSPAI
jgi:hypothetical protein